MKILKSWLQEYIDIKMSNDELMERLTDSGSLVDSFSETLDANIIVAKILEVLPHPNADKLRLAKVSDGTITHDIVCGAPNIEPGQIVPLAKVGAKIGDITISEAKIRGEVSRGMLCSAKELGLGEDHTGILIFDPETELGQPISNIFDSDLLLDLEITPNRGDCLSHLGMAREITAITEQSLSKQPLSLNMSSKHASEEISISIKDIKACSRYYARVIQGVKIASSPEWLQKRLIMCDIKPINNIVDITNYIMLDLGQPLHAFDASCLKDKQIVVRKAKKDESIVTLDGELRHLSSSDIVIADSETPVAIAGVMGGFDSQITEDTTDIVIEAAQFDRVSVRKTAKNLKLMTEASYRFERGIDPAIIEYAVNKAAKMMQELAGGTILSGIVKEDSPVSSISVEYKNDDINRLLGTDLNSDQIARYLRLLGFHVADGKATVPTWRHDITIWQDLSEEIVRLLSLSRVKMIPVPKTTSPKKSPYHYKEFLKDLLVAQGFSEVYNYSFMSEADLQTSKIAAQNLLEVANPVSPENKYMRNSLVPGMLGTVAKNPTFDPVLIFEIGNVFNKTEETTKLCIASSGSGADKSIAEALESVQKYIKLQKEESEVKMLSREELQGFKIKKPAVYYIEIDLSNIQKRMKVDENKLKIRINKKEVHYRSISKYPSLTRDLAFILNKDIHADLVKKDIYSVSELVNNVELFDEFISDKFGKDMKNLAFHIYLQSQDRTLNDQEANDLILRIIELVSRNFKAKLRDK